MPGSVPLLSKNFYSHSLILWLCEVATLGVVGRGPDVSLSRRGASATLVYMLGVAKLT